MKNIDKLFTFANSVMAWPDNYTLNLGSS